MISSSWKSKKLDRNITTSNTTARFLNDEPKFMIFCIFLNPSNFYSGRFQDFSCVNFHICWSILKKNQLLFFIKTLIMK